MITENIKNLFSFIDYLHSSIPYLLSKQNLIDGTNELLEKRSSIKLNENYKSKIEYDKIQLEVSEKFVIVEAEIIFPLKHKIKELNVAEINTPTINLTAYSDLFELQRNFDEEDLKLIFEAKQKYLDFRNKTNFDYYLQFFFFELDRTLKEFYEFFKDDDFNEFTTLQTNVVTIESLDEQGIEKAVRKLTGNSNKLYFETFPEFLNYFKTNFNDIEIDERHSEAKRLLEQKRLKLENSTSKSEIDEVKEFSENAVKDFKHKLMLSFTNENYKTKFNGGIDPHLIAIGKLNFEYENLYNSAKNKSDIFNYLSTLSKEEIEDKIQSAETLKRICEISIDYSKDGRWSVGSLPIEFETITKIDLFIENFIKSIEILAKEGKDINPVIDLYLQTAKTNLENPLLEKNVKINQHLYNKLVGVKLLFSDVKKDNNKTIGFYSIPNDFDPNDDWEKQKRKCEIHNQTIYREYEENLERAKKTMSDLVSDMLGSTKIKKQIVEYDLLERRFSQVKSIYLQALNTELDRGCTIEGLKNFNIELKFNELMSFYQKSINDIDIHFRTLEGLKKRDSNNDLESNSKATQKQLKKGIIAERTELLKRIETAFSFMQHNDPRKHKQILNDNDFDSLIKWVSYYFENNFILPEIDTSIKVINTNKGNVVYTFIKIFKDLHPAKTRPESLFELIKLCFYDYRNDSITNYKKQKEPQFYSHLVNKK